MLCEWSSATAVPGRILANLLQICIPVAWVKRPTWRGDGGKENRLLLRRTFLYINVCQVAQTLKADAVLHLVAQAGLESVPL